MNRLPSDLARRLVQTFLGIFVGLIFLLLFLLATNQLFNRYLIYLDLPTIFPAAFLGFSMIFFFYAAFCAFRLIWFTISHSWK